MAVRPDRWQVVMMLNRMFLLGSCAGLAMLVLASSAAAQMPRTPSAPGVPGVPGAQHSRLNTPRQVSKPFSNLDRGPVLSPYMGLLRDDSADALPAYFAFVRPQAEQQAVNRLQQRNFQQLDRDVQQMQGTNPFPVGGSTGIRSTGHDTRFMNFMQFYPK